MTPPIERANVTTHQPDNHKMKPTQIQLDRLTATAISEPGDMAQAVTAVIEYWESIRPADPEIEALHAEVATLKASLPEWIPVAERTPDSADHSSDDWLVYLTTDGKTSAHGSDCSLEAMTYLTHFLDPEALANLPKRQAPTPEQIEANAIEAAWESARHNNFESFEAGWKAARAK